MADPPIEGPYRTALPRGQGETVAPGSPNVAQAVSTMPPPPPMVRPMMGSFGPVPGGAFLPTVGPAPIGGAGAPPASAPDQVKRDAALQYAPMIRRVQDRRKQIEAEWLLHLDAWKGKHRRQGFRGEWFNHYIPAARRSLEKFVTRVRQMLFPSPD